MNIEEIHAHIGSDYFSFDYYDFNEILPPNMSVTKHTEKDVKVTRYTVNGHAMEYHELNTDAVDDAHPTKYPITCEEDMEAMIEFFSAVEYEAATEVIKAHNKYVAKNNDKFFLFPVRPSPLMDLVQYKTGIEEYSFLSYDYPELMEQLIDSMHNAQLKYYKKVAEYTDIDSIISIENTSTTLISPQLFSRYSRKHLTEYNEVLAQYGKRQILHMCGKLKLLLPDLAEIPAAAMEAFTSPTVGDTTIRDGFTNLPNKVIIGGSCASLWASENPTLIANTILSDIENAGGVDRLILSSGGEIPYTATPDIIKKVREIIHGTL